MIDKMVSVGSKWIDSDNKDRIVIVREIISEDGELWIKYGMHAQDTIYGTTYEKFFNRFTRVVA
jgi:hypothetical protein